MPKRSIWTSIPTGYLNILEIGATGECTQRVAAALHDTGFQIDELQFANNSHRREFAWMPHERLIRARKAPFFLARAGERAAPSTR